MEMKKDYRRMMTIELMADDEKGYDEIKPFLTAMKKIEEDSSTIGFMRRFSKNEQIILKGIWDQIKDDAQFTIEKTKEGDS